MKRVAAACVAALLLAPAPAAAYSVLAHEANVDALWEPAIRPLLLRRYPKSTPADLEAARAYAYGGSVIQDLGYYPFGNHFFSNLVHYVRGGDFVEALIHDAQDVNELAFGLGALAHYAADNVGHPEATNKALPLMFPKLRAKYGDTVTYVQAPAQHVIVEFSFDVVQVAAGAYLPDTYHAFIGFQVAKPALERAFREVYGLEMKDVFGDEDLAIATYRHAVSGLIPHLTRTAWKTKKDKIAQLTPGVKESAFIYTYTRRQYEKEFGTGYQKPGWFGRLIGIFYRLLPKVGPLKPLSFKTPTPEAEALFAASFKDARTRYSDALEALARGRLNLRNTDFDTGKPSRHGEYALADKTYAELIDRLSKDDFESAPQALRRNITAYYASTPPRTLTREEEKRMEKVRKQLAALRAAAE
jgi:zinc dependent phospholipase C